MDMILIGNLHILYPFFSISKWEVLFNSSCFPSVRHRVFQCGQMYHLHIVVKPWGATARPVQDDSITEGSWAYCWAHLGYVNLDCLSI